MAYFNFKGRKVYYDITGDSGKPILILNGIMMSTKSWDPFVDTLSENNILIRLDFLDQGQSDLLENSLYTQDMQVEVIETLLKEINISKVTVVGISYGGEVAIQFAIKKPNSVERLLLFNTTAYTSPWLQDIGRSWNEIAKTRNGRSYYLATIPIIYSPVFYQTNLDWMRKREAILAPVFSDEVFLNKIDRLTYSAEKYDVRNQLHLITAPTLIVSADQDYLTPMHEQNFLHENIKGSELVLLPNVGHASMYEKPILFTTLVLGYTNAKDTEYNV